MQQTAVVNFFALVAMVTAAAFINVGCLAAPSAAGDAEQMLSRQRRRVDQMGAMVTMTTGRHFSDFLGYGNYCGFLGSGNPVDSLDACCQAHDRCYGVVQAENKAGNCTATDGDGAGVGVTPTFNIYLTRYNYSIGTGGVIECLNANTSYPVDGSDNSTASSSNSTSGNSSISGNSTISTNGSFIDLPESVSSKPASGYPACQRHLCECDRALAQCLKTHVNQYNAKHLSPAQAALRQAIKWAEKYPDTYDAAWDAVAKLMGEQVTAAPGTTDDGSNLNGATGGAGNSCWLLALLVSLRVAEFV